MERKIKFDTYTRPSGKNEFNEFYLSLPTKEQAKLMSVIKKTEEYGLAAAIQQQWVDIIDSDIFELRARFAKNYERALYFHVDGSNYMITHGFKKKTNKTPQREIKHAHDLMKEYYKNKKGKKGEI